MKINKFINITLICELVFFSIFSAVYSSDPKIDNLWNNRRKLKIENLSNEELLSLAERASKEKDPYRVYLYQNELDARTIFADYIPDKVRTILKKFRRSKDGSVNLSADEVKILDEFFEKRPDVAKSLFKDVKKLGAPLRSQSTLVKWGGMGFFTTGLVFSLLDVQRITEVLFEPWPAPVPTLIMPDPKSRLRPLKKIIEGSGLYVLPANRHSLPCDFKKVNDAFKKNYDSKRKIFNYNGVLYKINEDSTLQKYDPVIKEFSTIEIKGPYSKSLEYIQQLLMNEKEREDFMADCLSSGKNESQCQVEYLSQLNKKIPDSNARNYLQENFDSDF